MPLVKDNIITTLRTKDKIIRVDELLTQTEILSLITNETAVHNAGYKPDVITSIKTTNQTNLNSLGIANDFVLLVGQTTSSENGLYKQTGATTTTKQTVSANTFYVEKQTTNELRAIFNESINKYIQVYNTNFNINHTLAIAANTTTAQTVFELPTLKDKPSIINLDVFGYFTANKDHTFSGSYKAILVYDTNGTDDSGIKTLGTFPSKIKRNGSFSIIPIITFDNGVNPALLKITYTDVANATNWTFRGRISI